MSLFVYLDGTNVATGNIRLNALGNQGVGGLAAAADGTGAQGSIVFDDSAGTLDVLGWMPVTVEEPDCTSARRLFTGYVADYTYKRGPYRLGASRQIDATINDSNVLLSNALISGQDGNRGAETDADTIDWLLSTYLAGEVYDLGLVNPPPRDFDATNYIGSTAADVLAALCEPRGQIFFTYWDQTAHKVGLFYDSPTSTAFTCTLTISNVLSDVNNTTCFEPLMDGELEVDPSDVYSLIRYSKKGGSIVRTNTTTKTTFFPTINNRGIQVTNDRVGLRSTAITFAERLLNFYSTERETLKFTVRLPSTKVGLIQAGMRIGCRFTHLRGFETLTYTRIERLNIVPTDGDPTQYDVTVECSAKGIATGGGAGPGGGDTTPFPYDPPSSSGPCGDGTTQLSIASGAHQSADSITLVSGNYLYILRYDLNVHWLGTSRWHLYLDTAGSTDPRIHPALYMLKTQDQSALHLTDSVGSWISGSPPDALMHVDDTYPQQEGTFVWESDGGIPPVYYGVVAIGTATPVNNLLKTVPAGTYYLWSGNPDGDGYFGASGYTGSVCLIQSSTPPASFVSPASSTGDPPDAGNPVSETVTMTGAGGTTSFTFANESLRVFVDDVDHSDDITTYDGIARTFQLDFIPYSFETVRVEYIKA